MVNEDPVIKIIGVDKDKIRESSSLSGAWVIPFKLSSIPSESWGRNFYEICQRNSNANKRKTSLLNDCIEVNCTEKDEQQKVLDMLMLDILNTNAVCQDIYHKKIKMQEDIRIQQQSHANTLQRIKDDIEKLKF